MIEKIFLVLGAISMAFLLLCCICVFTAEKYEIEDFETVPVIVERGDTAWNIAEEYCPSDMDRRKYLYLCAQANGESGMLGNIQAGEMVLFLKLKGE